jgi:hypothetical protein
MEKREKGQGTDAHVMKDRQLFIFARLWDV